MQDKTKILAIMLQNSAKDSDRDIARKAKVSQPTITRFRRELEETGVIRNFQVIPDFNKIGYPIFAILTIKLEDKMKQYLNFEEIIFQADTPTRTITLSVHKTFSEFVEFLREIESSTEDIDVTTLGLTRDIAKTFKIGNLNIDLGREKRGL